MQGFNTQRDTGFLRVRQNCEQAIQHCGPRVLQSLAIGWARDDYEDGSAEQRGLLIGNAIVFYALAAFVGGRRREPPSTAQTGDVQTFPANHRRCLLCIAAEFMTPHADVRNTAGGTIADGPLKRPRIGCHLIEAEALQQIHATPASRRKVCIRAIASSGSHNTPARSASTNSSHRCTTERALSKPRTMRKWD